MYDGIRLLYRHTRRAPHYSVMELHLLQSVTGEICLKKRHRSARSLTTLEKRHRSDRSLVTLKKHYKFIVCNSFFMVLSFTTQIAILSGNIVKTTQHQSAKSNIPPCPCEPVCLPCHLRHICEYCPRHSTLLHVGCFS